jgi:hypothetical protein
MMPEEPLLPTAHRAGLLGVRRITVKRQPSSEARVLAHVVTAQRADSGGGADRGIEDPCAATT